MSYTSPEMTTYEVMVVFAENIKALRRQKQWTLEELAAKLEMTTTEYCNLEAATVELTMHLICKIADIYELDPAALLISTEAASDIEAELQQELNYLVDQCREQEAAILEEELKIEALKELIRELKNEDFLNFDND